MNTSIRRDQFDAINLSDIIDHDVPDLPPVHPGDVLRHDFLEPLGMSANALGDALRVPTNRLTAIMNRARSVTADTALRLARYFGTTPEFWLNLQDGYDLALARREVGAQIAAEIMPRAA